MTGQPQGTVTFLFTDIEGSTRLWQDHPDAMQPALARHDKLLRAAIELHGGYVVKTTGDGFHAAFTSPADAVNAAVATQRSLRAESWAGTPPLRVRVGLHTGIAELRDGDYYGSAVNRAARIMSIGHGDQILCSEATASLVRGALDEALALRDLREHRLRDLSEAERVFQVDAPDLPSEFPALNSLDTRTTNLPLQHTSFLGREQELDDLVALVDEYALVTVTGVGGIGKTRLALQAAAEMLPRFPDGVWLCELAPATDPDSVAAIVAEVLDARPRAGLTTEEAVVEAIRHRRLLLVVDNCEHVLDAVTDLVGAIVDECADVHVLATSREGLAIEGEHVRPLRSLAVPDGEAAAASSAVQLFVDRARAARGEFVLDDGNRESVVEICRRLDGMPLAIELAAARIVALQAGEIAALLDERFRLLKGNRRRAVDRHQTLRATVEWSYSLLTPVEQVVFDRLSVFSGSFDSAASSIAGDDTIDSWEVLDAIESLVAKSMLNADDDESTTRYSLLETLRSYGQERLDATGDADARRRRHAEYYAQLADRLGGEVHGPDEVRTMRAIRRDLDNFRSATFWALDTEDDRSLALEIVAALASLSTADRASGVSAWADECLPFLAETTPGRGSSILGAAAWFSLDRGDLVLARARATAALAALHDPDCREPIIALSCLGVIGGFFGQREPVLAMLDHVEPLLGPPVRAVHLAHLLGSVATLIPLVPDTAVSSSEYAAQSMRYATESQNPTALAQAHFAMGLAGDLDAGQARAQLEECIALIEAGAADTVYAYARRGASRAALDLGDMAASAHHLQLGIQHAHRVGDGTALEVGLDEAVVFLSAAGDPEGALTLVGYREHGALPTMPLPDIADRIDAAAEAARSAVGEAAAEDAHRRGRAMDTHEAVAFALERLSRGAVVQEGGTAR